MKTALVTGAAGFIGSTLTIRLLAEGWRVVGLDNLNDYYTPELKEARLANIASQPGAANFTFHKQDLVDREALVNLALQTKPDAIIHLAAQAGVRYGLVNQVVYLESNLIGHFNVLAAAKALKDAGTPTSHFLYASSSSVYGANEKVPFEESDDVSRPVSLYAATKRADELITHAWSHQFAIPATGMRFFTVYGPWGRPDMSPFLFAKAILEQKPIALYNSGDLWRDFTYVDDIVEAIVRLIPVVPAAEPTPHALFNLGNQNPVQMRAFVQTLGEVMGATPIVDNQDWPATEVYKTYADTTRLNAAIGWSPSTPLATGLARLAEWYKTARAQGIAGL